MASFEQCELLSVASILYSWSRVTFTSLILSYPSMFFKTSPQKHCQSFKRECYPTISSRLLVVCFINVRIMTRSGLCHGLEWGPVQKGSLHSFDLRRWKNPSSYFSTNSFTFSELNFCTRTSKPKMDQAVLLTLYLLLWYQIDPEKQNCATEDFKRIMNLEKKKKIPN